MPKLCIINSKVNESEEKKMSYSVNPSVFKSIFAVPTDIVDKHIRLANEHQLKVLLWILRNSPNEPDIEKMCSDLKINIDDASDYLQYWILTGVISEDCTPSKPIGSKAFEEKSEKTYTTAHKQSEEAAQPSALVSKPSSAEIAARIDESPEIGYLFNEAQRKLGKTIGYDGQCTLLLLHDHYGLPVDVLFMLIDYCVSVGKTNYGYLETVGKDWGNREIDTLDKAAEQISALRKANSLWTEFSKAVGISNPRPTTKQSEYLRRWNSELGFGVDMIILAYEEMANHTGKLSFAYIEKVLMNWSNLGYKTPADVESGKESQKLKKSSTGGEKSPASYDLGEFKERSLHGELKYERKKKK